MWALIRHEGPTMRYRGIDFLVEIGVAESRQHAYRLIRQKVVPGAVKIGCNVKIDVVVFESEMRARAQSATREGTTSAAGSR